MQNFQVGDIVQMKYVDNIGSVIEKIYSTTGETLYKIMWLTSTTQEHSYCRKESLKNPRPANVAEIVWS